MIYKYIYIVFQFKIFKLNTCTIKNNRKIVFNAHKKSLYMIELNILLNNKKDLLFITLVFFIKIITKLIF